MLASYVASYASLCYIMLHITRSIVQGAGLGTFLFLIYILELKPICNFNVLCKYADDLSQLCPQHSPSDFAEKFSHFVRWAEVSKRIINSSKLKRSCLGGHRRDTDNSMLAGLLKYIYGSSCC